MITYSELIKLESYEERLEALILHDYHYESPRELMMDFYKSHIWKTIRKQIILRDLGFDLGVIGCDIQGKVYVHHIDPVTEYDIINMTDKLTNPENLITVSMETHNIIHYGRVETYEERKPGDTIFW